MAAMLLPLQLKSWKGCIAELMAQPLFRFSLLRTMDFQAGNVSMGLTILMSLQLNIPFARSPSFIAAAPSSICRDCHEMCLTCWCAVELCAILLVVI